MRTYDPNQGEPQTGQETEDLRDPEARYKCELGR